MSSKRKPLQTRDSIPASMKAILFDRPGPPEVLRYADVPTPVPAAGQVLVRAHTIGVSMPEILVRRGEYAWMPPLPAIPGIEMSGTVVSVGEGVKSLEDRPDFRLCPGTAGSRRLLSQYLAANADALYPLPQGTDIEAAAALSNYQVAWHLLYSAPRGMPYESVLVTGAAGGHGCDIVQLGLVAVKRMIGLVDTDEKASLMLSDWAPTARSIHGWGRRDRTRERNAPAVRV